MRKRKKGRRLSRKKSQRKALLRSLANALILKEKIKTTEAKAKEVFLFVEKQIALSKKADLSARKLLSSRLPSAAAKKLSEEISVRYKDRKGGYTRIMKLGQRKSDGARMAIIELVK